MPELPEIETMRGAVRPLILGKRIETANILRNTSAGNDLSGVAGLGISDVIRRAKALIISLGDGSRLVFRFGMTGTLLVLPNDVPVHRHARILFGLNDGYRMEFRDMRLFGRVWHIHSDDTGDPSGLSNAGLEPSDPELTGAYLSERFGHRGISVKSALLTQDTVCGLGNIYSDEVLWRTGICPLTPCSEMCQTKWGAIANTIPEVISEAIDRNAVTMDEFAADGGIRYRFNDFDAYGRKGKPCRRCGTPMVKSAINGRGSTWCPACQPPPHTITYK